jgi:diguanylate cyclase (GGDEF) domain
MITKPFEQLAMYASDVASYETENKIREIKAWCVELINLKKSVFVGIRQSRKHIETLTHQVSTDPLTKLQNRRSMEEFITKIKERKQTACIIFIDIDRFKSINDIYGHDAGDTVLYELASFLTSRFRNDDLLCRLGGEEFVAILPDTDIERAYRIAERIRVDVSNKIFNIAGSITISSGVTRWTPDTENESQALLRADKLMYEAKNQGRNRVIVEDPVHNSA